MKNMLEQNEKGEYVNIYKRLYKALDDTYKQKKFNYKKYVGHGNWWNGVYIVVNEHCWARNFTDNYTIDVYENERYNHLTTYEVSWERSKGQKGYEAPNKLVLIEE